MRQLPYLFAGASALILSSCLDVRAEPLLGGSVLAPEGALEGVLISAKKSGTNKTITVVSDAKGVFAFPAGRLNAGEYDISIRAIGYDLEGPQKINLTEGMKPLQVKLAKTKDLGAQMSNAEWIMSMPGDEKLKNFFTDCTGCHSLHRVVEST